MTSDGRVGVTALCGFAGIVGEGSGLGGMGIGLGGTGGTSSPVGGVHLKGLFVTGSFSISPW